MTEAPSVVAFGIRDARATDIDQIVLIERQSFGDPWSRESFESFLEADWNLFVAAYPWDDPGAVVAYATVRHFGDEAELLNIAVHPEWRGKGVARRLLDHSLASLRRLGVEVLFLEVRESNHRARRLYEAKGFSEISRRRRYYRKPVEDALILRRLVRDPDPDGSAMK